MTSGTPVQATLTEWDEAQLLNTVDKANILNVCLKGNITERKNERRGGEEEGGGKQKEKTGIREKRKRG